MSLIACPACDRAISPNATACPGCGEPISTSGAALLLGKKKNRYTAIVLAVLLGTFGAHRFYLNKPFSGVVYLLLCWTSIPTILGILEGILMWCHSDSHFHRETVGKKRVKYARVLTTPSE